MTRRFVAGVVALCLLVAPLLAKWAPSVPSASDILALAVQGALCSGTKGAGQPNSPQPAEHRALCIDLCMSSCLGGPAPAPAAVVFVPAALAHTVRAVHRPGTPSAPSIRLPFTRGPPATS